MRVLGLDKLKKFYQRHSQAKGALDSWHDEVKRAQWKTSHDIKRRYANADFLADNKVVFNIKGNHFRLVVQVIYTRGLVIIERVGTHADYDKWRL